MKAAYIYLCQASVAIKPSYCNLQASQTRNLLQATSPYTVGTTAGVNPPYPSLTLPQVYALIRAANANITNSAGLGVKQLVSVSKQGVAGNGLCEAGEMPSTDGNYTGGPMPLLHFLNMLMTKFIPMTPPACGPCQFDHPG